MLIIRLNPINVERPYVNPSWYSPAKDTRPLVEIVKELRIKSEELLSKRHPAVDIDTAKSKAICLKGGTGSLRRSVDIVPANWYDNIQFQTSRSEVDRGVDVYDKGNHTQFPNFPFKHIAEINSRDSIYDGNLKCVIRLMKNLVADMPEAKQRTAQKLSSYDLAAIAYHMGPSLRCPKYSRLSLVDSLRSHLLLLTQADIYRDSLWVPDGTRKIFDKDEKTDALDVLAHEVNALAEGIYKSLNPNSNFQYSSAALQNKQVAW